MTISILGTGWLGAVLFETLVADGTFTVYGSSRQAQTRTRLQNFARVHGTASDDIIEAVQTDNSDHRMFSINAPEFKAADLAFFKTDVLVITLPPGRKRADVVTVYGNEIAAIIARAEQGTVKHLIYTSSTGIYGDAQGKVDEQSSPDPKTESAKAVLKAEELLLRSVIPTTILRLAGLYGPQRHPGRWLAGKTDLPDGDAPVNLVHRADVVQAIKKVINSSPSEAAGIIYNVCAASHPGKREFYSRAATQLGLAPPVFHPGGEAGKRISSAKLRAVTGWLPAYDDLPL